MLILNRWECAITSIITNEGAEGEDGTDGKDGVDGQIRIPDGHRFNFWNILTRIQQRGKFICFRM